MKSKRPGERLAGAYTAAWYNWVTRTLEALLRAYEIKTKSTYSNRIQVKAYGVDDFSTNRFSAVNIVGPIITDGDGDDKDNTMFSNIHLRVDDELSATNPWGVIQGPVNSGSTPDIVLEGLTWCRYTQREDWHTSVDFIDDEIKSCVGGRGLLIQKQKSGSQIGLIFLRPRPTSHIEGTVYESFTGAPATFKVTPDVFASGEKFTPDDGYIEVVNRMGWEAAGSGAAAQAIYDPEQDEWKGTQLEC
jgi:hypothetical protein